jgi:hypothetical protein
MLDPPRILRIKRKRNQDPLQALVFEDSRKAKKSKPSTPSPSKDITPTSTPPPPEIVEAAIENIYFRLTRTDDFLNDLLLEDSILSIDCKEAENLSNDGNHNNKFIIPKPQQDADNGLAHELSDLVDSYLNVNDQGDDSKRKKRTKNISNVANNDDDYVYDVYHISAEPLTSANHPKTQIGYIRFFDDDNDLYQSDDEDNPDSQLVSDEEDSNAEDFYQNDYPSDEDAGSNSDISILHKPIDVNGLMNDFDLDENDYDQDFENVDYLQDDQFFKDEASSVIEGNELFPKRNQFFKSDEYDELAIHRDRIFGKLQSMINERK